MLQNKESTLTANNGRCFRFPALSPLEQVAISFFLSLPHCKFPTSSTHPAEQKLFGILLSLPPLPSAQGEVAHFRAFSLPFVDAHPIGYNAIGGASSSSVERTKFLILGSRNVPFEGRDVKVLRC